MNNKVQQKFDRSIREAVETVQRSKDLRHAEQQAYAEQARREMSAVAPKCRRSASPRPRRPRMVLRRNPETGGTELVPVQTLGKRAAMPSGSCDHGFPFGGTGCDVCENAERSMAQ